MKIPYLTISYDSFWHQVVVGYGLYELNKLNRGCRYWARLFGIGRQYKK